MATTKVFSAISGPVSRWASAKKRLATVMLDSVFARFVCGIDDALVEELRLDDEVREAVVSEMVHHMPGCAETVVQLAVSRTLVQGHYDLTDQVARCNLLPDGVVTDEDLAKVDLTREEVNAAMLIQGKPPRPTAYSPAFISSMSCLLTSKLGKMDKNVPGNLEVVEREYFRLGRKMNVRVVDLVANRQYVLNTVFSDTVFDNVPMARTRIPRWLKLLRGDESRRTATKLC